MLVYKRSATRSSTRVDLRASWDRAGIELGSIGANDHRVAIELLQWSGFQASDEYPSRTEEKSCLEAVERVCAWVWPDKGEVLSARQPTHQPTHNQALCFALFCFILLYSASFCFILLHFALFCFILLYSASFALFFFICFVLLYSTLFCCILLVPAQIRANSRSCCVFVCVCMTCAHDVCAWRVCMWSNKHRPTSSPQGWSSLGASFGLESTCACVECYRGYRVTNIGLPENLDQARTYHVWTSGRAGGTSGRAGFVD